MRYPNAVGTILFALSASVLLAAGAGAQTKERFVSVYGGFSIDLPRITTVTKGFRDRESDPPSAGTVYAWDTGPIVYTVRYSRPDSGEWPDISSEARLAYENRAVRDTVKQYGGTIVSETQSDTGYTLGTTIVAKVGNGILTAFNFIAKNGNAYSVQSIARDAKDDPTAVRVLASFALVDGEKLIDDNISSLTPPSFPESPKRIWAPDRRTENLRGPVKSVIERKQESEGDVALHSLRMTFDPAGAQTSAVRFDTSGMPSEVEVFGFENGLRVSRTRSAENPANEEMTLYRKRFDRSGRPFRTASYNSEGALTLRTVYERSGNSLVTYIGDETVRFTSRSVLNRFGDPVITDFTAGSGENSRTISLRFRYHKRDRFGNWTRKTILRKSEDGKWDEQSVVFREIEYYGKK